MGYALEVKGTPRAIAWTCRKVLPPLVLFFVSVIVRFMVLQKCTWDLISPSDLSFSVATLCILVVIASGKLDDRELSQSISSVYAAFLVVFLLFFGVSLYITTQFDLNALNAINAVLASIQTGAAPNVSLLAQLTGLSSQSGTISTIRWMATGSALIVVPATIWLGSRYELEA